VAKNRAANDSFADRQNTASSTMSDGNIDGGEYSSDKAIAAILFVFDTNATSEGLCPISPPLSVISAR
jgi:hypothetical protein